MKMLFYSRYIFGNVVVKLKQGESLKNLYCASTNFKIINSQDSGCIYGQTTKECMEIEEQDKTDCMRERKYLIYILHWPQFGLWYWLRETESTKKGN